MYNPPNPFADRRLGDISMDRMLISPMLGGGGGFGALCRVFGGLGLEGVPGGV
jgi:hypothetical protein